MKSASPGPIWCKATSLNGVKVKPPIPVNGDLSVVSEAEWQSTQPIPGVELLVPNSALPLSSEDEAVVGVGGADNLMKAAKLTVSEDIWLAVPVVPPPLGLVMLVESSGVELNTQPATAARSFWKTSLATPCSTL
jgi:hypothetical protein